MRVRRCVCRCQAGRRHDRYTSMEIALADDRSANPAPRLLELRAGLYVMIGLLMIMAAVARPESRLVAVAVILSVALLPTFVPDGEALSRMEAAILADILAGFVAWLLFPADPIFGTVITAWAVALSAFLVEVRSSRALLGLAFLLEVLKVPIASLAYWGFLQITVPSVQDVALHSATSIVILAAVYFGFRTTATYIARSRSAAQVSQARYRALVERAPTPVMVLDGEKIAYANESAQTLLDEPVHEVVGRAFADWLPESDHEAAAALFSRVGETDEAIVVRDRTIRRRDGSTSLVDASIAPVEFRGRPSVQIVLIDVTDRNLAEKALRESEERFRSAFVHSATPIAITEFDTTFSQVNNALGELLGYAEEELIGRRWSDMIHEDDVAAVLEAGRRSASGGPRTFRVEVRMLTKNGVTRWVRLDVATLIGGADGTRFIALGNDITDQREAERALRDSEERYRSLFERIPVALYRTLPDGTILDGNPALGELLGAPLDQLIGGSSVAYYDRPDDRKRLEDRLGGERIVSGYEARLRRADGTAIWVRDTARIVEDEDHAFYEGALVDVTARRDMEVALRLRASQQEVVARLGQGALEGRPIDEVIDRALQAVVEMLDIESAVLIEAVGDDIPAVRSSVGWDRDPAMLVDPMRPRTGIGSPPIVLTDRAEVLEQIPGLDEFEVHSAANVVVAGPDDAFGTLWAFSATEGAFAQDDLNFLLSVANVLGAAMERSWARERLEELVRSKDEFIASVSHELRTPLTVVSGMAHELHDSWPLFADDERAEFMDMLVEQSRDMSDLIEDLLVAARADIGKVTVLVEEVDVGVEVDTVLAGLQRDVRKRISVEHQPCAVLADPMRLRQIVRNLLTNAIRYGGDTITVRMRCRGQRAFLSVADDGQGVPGDDAALVFDAYHRAHVTKGQPGSVGIGLTVSKMLATLMGGDLTYRFEDGAVFEIELPVAASRAPLSAGVTG